MCEILDSAMRVNPPELQSQLKFILERLKSTGDDHKDGKIGKKSCKNIFLFFFFEGEVAKTGGEEESEEDEEVVVTINRRISMISLCYY